ncbi:hypothetical protein GCM10019059_08080 [Camelimonas fluminis]|uniref:Type IIL restriction-modification enzyme MmeI n=1 Tax=Camelimonas fluminis TaxID=1576911 RepID=A0ABV7UEB1_9HYPH|nr:type IIL restriction-modification enzyme MmeI [Camelimonas fluminis]GHE51227.1 hypothetical protein GCM10019059_08080 [Camelimonas fluminis]
MGLDSIYFLIEESKKSGPSEISNAQLFICRLCEALALPLPQFAAEHDCDNHYIFEKSVSFGLLNGRACSGRIDLYKRGCFVLESKQSTMARRKAAGWPPPAPATRSVSAWRRAMNAARMQAENYARALPEPPPFLIILDVGHMIEIYADFSGTGEAYAPFPDPARRCIVMDDLRRADIQQRLRAIWTNPGSLASELSASPAREDALTRYLLDRAAARARGQPRLRGQATMIPEPTAGRFAPRLGVRECGSACRILV